MSRWVVLLATCAAMPDGEEWGGTNLLLPALAARGVEGRWVVWDDPAVDWSGGLVAVRSTWDYEKRLPEFLDWTRSIPWMLNSAAAFAWNTDKAYLLELAAAGVDVVPTVSADTVEEVVVAVRSIGAAVVKPRVGAGGRGVLVIGDGGVPGDLGRGPWVVQPLVESVREVGETSVYVGWSGGLTGAEAPGVG